MSEADSFIQSGKQLNSWVEEEIEVDTIVPIIDEKNKRVVFENGKKKMLQKTYYAHSIPKMIICSDHEYKPLDSKKYIFKCKKCDYHFKASIITHKYDPQTGKLLYRKTNEPVV